MLSGAQPALPGVCVSVYTAFELYYASMLYRKCSVIVNGRVLQKGIHLVKYVVLSFATLPQQAARNRLEQLLSILGNNY